MNAVSDFSTSDEMPINQSSNSACLSGMMSPMVAVVWSDRLEAAQRAILPVSESTVALLLSAKRFFLPL